MVKPEKVPPVDDEFRYLVIKNPFPLHPELYIESERYKLAHWIASCIGQKYLTAIYYKPSASSMVIIEVKKNCPKINSLLGLHKWNEFLKNPAPDQVDKKSQIYYCRYSITDELRKYTWKCLEVLDNWFDKYDPVNGPFRANPYPKTTFCEVPREIQVDYGLCRPLPMDVFPRPKPHAKRTVVPGSDKYVEIKKGNGNSGQPQSPVIAIPIPPKTKKPTKSWVSITSSNISEFSSEASYTQTIPRASANGSPRSNHSSSTASSNASPIGPPPGLEHPPGLSTKVSQVNSVWDFDPSPTLPGSGSSSDRADGFAVTAANVEIITTGFAAAAISAHYQRGEAAYKEHDDEKFNEQNKDEDREEEEEENYWAVQPPRPVDWDKPMCPVHQGNFCRAGICKKMAEIEKQKKREVEKAERWASAKGIGNDDDDGRERPKTGGRGYGRGRGQMRGRGRGGSRKWV